VSGIREATAAGTFYPADAAELTRALDKLLDAAAPSAERRPWGLIVPHAGYVYSGPVAASGYVMLRPWTSEIARVVVLGPAHFVTLRGPALSSARAWRTPLGEVPLDDELREAALGVGCAVDDRAHEHEHALEVQLPFLQMLLAEGLRILPVAAGGEDAAEALEALSPLADLVVVSTDLSHYHDAATARSLDRRTAEAVVARDPGAIGLADACGRDALRAALASARRHDRSVRLLDLRSSADTAGDEDRVVVYGAFAIESKSRR
jgi:AmmeMemoRadiSam system protein B